MPRKGPVTKSTTAGKFSQSTYSSAASECLLLQHAVFHLLRCSNKNPKLPKKTLNKTHPRLLPAKPLLAKHWQAELKSPKTYDPEHRYRAQRGGGRQSPGAPCWVAVCSSPAHSWAGSAPVDSAGPNYSMETVPRHCPFLLILGTLIKNRRKHSILPLGVQHGGDLLFQSLQTYL